MNLEFQKHDKVLAHFNGYAINKFVTCKGYSGRVLPCHLKPIKCFYSNNNECGLLPLLNRVDVYSKLLPQRLTPQSTSEPVDELLFSGGKVNSNTVIEF